MSLCASLKQVFHIDIEPCEPCGSRHQDDPRPLGEDLANTDHAHLAPGRYAQPLGIAQK